MKGLSPSAKGNSPVKFELLKECSNCTEDLYWKQVFEDCSKGKFPRGSGITQMVDSLTKKITMSVYLRSGKTANKSETQWYKINEANTKEVIFSELKEKFQTFLGLKSKGDADESRIVSDILKKQLENSYFGDWKSIRKKSIKDILIRNFVLNLKKENGLSNYQATNILKLINLAFFLKWIDTNSVIYKNKEILSIEGLYRNEETGEFEIENNLDLVIKRDIIQKGILLSNYWKKRNEKGD